MLRFHAVYWPAFLLALDLKLPKTLLVHGHWLIDNKKMSKSLGNVIDPEFLFRRYGVDVIRYFLIADGKPGRDCGERCITDLMTFCQESILT